MGNNKTISPGKKNRGDKVTLTNTVLPTDKQAERQQTHVHQHKNTCRKYYSTETSCRFSIAIVPHVDTSPFLNVGPNDEILRPVNEWIPNTNTENGPDHDDLFDIKRKKD